MNCLISALAIFSLSFISFLPTAKTTVVLTTNCNQTLVNGDLTVELTCDNTNIIQGKPLNILAAIHNNTDKPIEIGAPRHYLYDFSRDSVFINDYGAGRFSNLIPASGDYCQFYDPQDYLVYSGIDFSTYTLYPGTYDYYISYIVGRNEIKSNILRIKILPVPDSLKMSFNDLKYKKGQYGIEKYEHNYHTYKNDFYGAEFLYKLLRTYKFDDAVRNIESLEYREQALNLYREFIKKYPDTKYAYVLIQSLIMDFPDNKAVIEDIINYLKREKPGCKLLYIFYHQPPQYNEKIKYLLN